MKKQILIGLLLMMIVFTTSFTIAKEQTRIIDEFCNFEYMDYCLLEIPRWESSKLYNIVEEDTFFHFYNLGKDKEVHGLIIDGDTDEMVFFNSLMVGKELVLEDGTHTGINIEVVKYNEADDVLYVVFEKKFINSN